MTSEMKQEYTLKISQANKTQMVVIIYEILFQYLDEARENLGNKDINGFHESIRKCTGCIRELSSSINFESEVSGNLMSLYVFCTKELAKADIHHSADELYGVEMVTRKLYKAAKVVAQQDSSPAIMGNAPKVYAGLTYGKESIIVNIHSNGSKGYTV